MSTELLEKKLNINLSPLFMEILQNFHDKGILCLLVGGCVRDSLLDVNSSDLDFEVYGVSQEELSNLLSPFGKVKLTGQQHAVLQFVGNDEYLSEADFGVPRKDNKTGVKHADVNVEVFPDMTPEEASMRRDFTVNALAYNPLTNTLYNFSTEDETSSCLQDLQDGILRHRSAQFVEDPLRIDRGMRFVGKFGFTVAPETINLMKDMMHTRQYLSNDRIWKEFVKWAETAKYPGSILEFMHSTEMDKQFYPEIYAMWDIPQEYDWHPEGVLQNHNKYVLNAAADIAHREELNDTQKSILILSALMHDIGKPDTTKLQDVRGVMRITSHGHDTAGGPIAQNFFEKMQVPMVYIKYIVPLVVNHMQHINFPDKSENQAAFVRKLAHRLRPATISQLLMLIEADHSGRPPLPKGLTEKAIKLRDKAFEEGVLHDAPINLINAADVQKYYDIPQGKHIGDVLKIAYDMFLKGRFNTRTEALMWLDNYMRYHAYNFSKQKNCGVSLLKGGDILKVLKNNNYQESKDILEEAWQAQINHDFNTHESAMKWLYNRIHS